MVFPVFHPAAALYAPANRQVLVEDFAKLRILLDRGWESMGAVRGETLTGEQSPVDDELATDGGRREGRRRRPRSSCICGRARRTWSWAAAM